MDMDNDSRGGSPTVYTEVLPIWRQPSTATTAPTPRVGTGHGSADGHGDLEFGRSETNMSFVVGGMGHGKVVPVMVDQMTALRQPTHAWRQQTHVQKWGGMRGVSTPALQRTTTDIQDMTDLIYITDSYKAALNVTSDEPSLLEYAQALVKPVRFLDEELEAKYQLWEYWALQDAHKAGHLVLAVMLLCLFVNQFANQGMAWVFVYVYGVMSTLWTIAGFCIWFRQLFPSLGVRRALTTVVLLVLSIMVFASINVCLDGFRATQCDGYDRVHEYHPFHYFTAFGLMLNLSMYLQANLLVLYSCLSIGAGWGVTLYFHAPAHMSTVISLVLLVLVLLMVASRRHAQQVRDRMYFSALLEIAENPHADTVGVQSPPGMPLQGQDSTADVLTHPGPIPDIVITSGAGSVRRSLSPHILPPVPGSPPPSASATIALKRQSSTDRATYNTPEAAPPSAPSLQIDTQVKEVNLREFLDKGVQRIVDAGVVVERHISELLPSNVQLDSVKVTQLLDVGVSCVLGTDQVKSAIVVAVVAMQGPGKLRFELHVNPQIQDQSQGLRLLPASLRSINSHELTESDMLGSAGSGGVPGSPTEKNLASARLIAAQVGGNIGFDDRDEGMLFWFTCSIVEPPQPSAGTQARRNRKPMMMLALAVDSDEDSQATSSGPSSAHTNSQPSQPSSARSGRASIGQMPALASPAKTGRNRPGVRLDASALAQPTSPARQWSPSTPSPPRNFSSGPTSPARNWAAVSPARNWASTPAIQDAHTSAFREFMSADDVQVTQERPWVYWGRTLASTSKTLRILLVDDLRTNRVMLGLILKFLGHTVVELEDGDQVESTLQSTKTPFHICILDISMDRSDGRDIAHRLRSSGSKLILIALSSTMSMLSSDLMTYFEAGFDGVLTKPFTKDNMEALLKSITQGDSNSAPQAGVAASADSLAIETKHDPSATIPPSGTSPGALAKLTARWSGSGNASPLPPPMPALALPKAISAPAALESSSDPSPPPRLSGSDRLSKLKQRAGMLQLAVPLEDQMSTIEECESGMSPVLTMSATSFQDDA